MQPNLSEVLNSLSKAAAHLAEASYELREWSYFSEQASGAETEVNDLISNLRTRTGDWGSGIEVFVIFDNADATAKARVLVGTYQGQSFGSNPRMFRISFDSKGEIQGSTFPGGASDEEIFAVNKYCKEYLKA